MPCKIRIGFLMWRVNAGAHQFVDEILKILGYSAAFFLAEMLVKIWVHL
jgi:hypothetical protein